MPKLNFFKYGKINSYFKRGDKGLFLPEVSHPSFECILEWNVYEKIDGTNIRIGYEAACEENSQTPTRYIGGRTEDAQMPVPLMEYINKTFSIEKLCDFFGSDNAIIFGEGIGPKIQGGKEKGYVPEEVYAFDIFQRGKWREDRLDDVVQFFNVKRAALIYPAFSRSYRNRSCEYGPATLYDMRPTPELFGEKLSCPPEFVEGYIYRPNTTLFNENGDRVMFKLKFKDRFVG